MKEHKMRTLLITGALLGIAATAQAQKGADWPPAPRFDLNDNYTSSEKKFVEKSLAPYYKFTERSNSWPVAKDPNLVTPNLGANAFEKMSLSALATGTFALSPYYYNTRSEIHPILNLKRQKAGDLLEGYYYNSPAADKLHSPLISPDGKTIVIREGLPPDDRYNGFNLHLWDLAKGRLRMAAYQPFFGFGIGIEPELKPFTRERESIFLPVVQWSPGSRFVSYLRGGNTFGDYDPRSSSYDLFVLDVPSRRDRLVMKNAGLHWSWTYRGSLLFSRVPPAHGRSVFEHRSRPSVYQASAAPSTSGATTLTPRKLFDGGAYAQESPDGNWIAFCDWPGPLFDAPKAADELKNSTRRGLFLFHRPTRRRIFVGELKLDESAFPADAPLLQWSPDGQSLYILEHEAEGDRAGLDSVVYKMELEQQTLQKLATLSFPSSRRGYFRARGTSPDGARLYFELREAVEGPRNFPNQQFTLLSVDTRSGQSTPLARLKNIANENPDWDWLDQSGTNPAHAQAQKIEAALPAWNQAAVKPARSSKPKSAPRTRTGQRKAS
jgi:hypothetical protein